MNHGYHSNIEKETLENENFRKVLFTAPNSQLVAMCLQPNQDIGLEVHHEHDQFFRIEQGTGVAVVGDQEYQLAPESAVVVPAGVEHNIINTSSIEKMKLYTIYSPPEHPDGTVHATKEEALASEH